MRLVLCLLLLLSWAARGQAQPAQAKSAEPQPSALAEPCEERCHSLSLVQLDPAHVLALFRGADQKFRLQTVDAQRGTPLGTVLVLGAINTAQEDDYELKKLRALALPSGDLALFSALRDGRISYLRGSSTPERRVAARVVRPASERVVSSFAVTPTPEGFALLVLTIQEQQRQYYSNEGGEFELHALDARGEPLRPVRRWKGAGTANARAAQCGDQLYLACRSRDSVFVRALDAATQKLSPDRRLALVGAEDLSPLYCNDRDAALLASWGTPNGGTVSRIALATLRAGDKRAPTWNKIALPAAPFALESAPVEGTQIAHVPIPLLDQGFGFATLDLATGALSASTLPRGGRGECLALRDGSHMLCASSERRSRKDGCPADASIALTLHGAPAEKAPQTARPLASDFFAPGQIEEPARPSSGDLARRNERLWCGEPGFAKLGDALGKWCKQHAREEDARAICGSEPGQLRTMFSSCSDLPAHCDQTRGKAPSVLRAPFAAGEPVYLRHEGCELRFSQMDARWQLDEVVCNDGG